MPYKINRSAERSKSNNGVELKLNFQKFFGRMALIANPTFGRLGISNLIAKHHVFLNHIHIAEQQYLAQSSQVESVL